ncbi:MAG: hypothetical protein H0W53_18365 [Acidobacteria bacterium]|nr:hypothetical protein [Acidobacteriota bacterium]
METGDAVIAERQPFADEQRLAFSDFTAIGALSEGAGGGKDSVFSVRLRQGWQGRRSGVQNSSDSPSASARRSSPVATWIASSAQIHRTGLEPAR